MMSPENRSGDEAPSQQLPESNSELTFLAERDECSNSKSEGDGDNEGESSGDQENSIDDQNEEEYTDYGESDEDDLDLNEIDLLLEEGLSKSKQTEEKSENGPVENDKHAEKPKEHLTTAELTIKKIVVLEEKGGNTFEVLPGGWIQVRHQSGLPLYLHRKSRVCSLTKPYFLGTASVRRHSIPLSAIPCLAYKRALAKEAKDKELLEVQAREMENQECEQPQQNPKEISEASDVLTKCLNVSSNNSKKVLGKGPLSVEAVAEKVKLLKRKLELEKTSEQPEKKGKKSPDSDSNSAIEQSTNDVMQTNPEETIVVKDTAEMVPEQVKEATSSQLKPVPEGRNKKDTNKNSGARTLIPLAKVETARENAHLYSITPLDLRDYCKSLFFFKEVECKRFKTWSARRRHTKEQKRKQLERPTLPDNAQVIKFFDISSSKAGGSGEEQIAKKFNDYVFNPNGKSSVCILHEFVQHALRKQPTYSFVELENATTPYSATVIINDVPYGRGYGSSKKTAKAEAAKATLEILIPQMKGQLNGNKTDTSNDFDITEYFQQVEMNDVRIPKMCTSVSEPSPYTLLLTCLQRNFGQSGSNIVKFDMIPADPTKGNPPNQFKMIAGNHSVVVTASNKREGKQLASQLLLSEIHPHITNFGAFIKMYGNGSIKSVKEKKQEEQQITTLQSKASANSPNWAILDKLRQEMLKLVDQDTQRKQEQEPLKNIDKNPLAVSKISCGNGGDETKCPLPKSKIKDSNKDEKPSNAMVTVINSTEKAAEMTMAPCFTREIPDSLSDELD